MRKIIILFAFTTLLFSCNRKSDLSEGKVEDSGLIKVNILLHQDLTKQNVRYIIANILDKEGYPIVNDSIKVTVNGQLLQSITTPNMGTFDYSYETETDVPIADEYLFEIELTDGKKYILGSIIPIQKMNEKDIVCSVCSSPAVWSEKGDLSQDVTISWQNLKEINELSVYKKYKSIKPDSTNNYQNDNNEIFEKIESSGKYTVSKTEYIKNNMPIEFIVFGFKASKEGKINPDLVAGSKIIIEGKIEKDIYFNRK